MALLLLSLLLLFSRSLHDGFLLGATEVEVAPSEVIFRRTRVPQYPASWVDRVAGDINPGRKGKRNISQEENATLRCNHKKKKKNLSLCVSTEDMAELFEKEKGWFLEMVRCGQVQGKSWDQTS